MARCSTNVAASAKAPRTSSTSSMTAAVPGGRPRPSPKAFAADASSAIGVVMRRPTMIAASSATRTNVTPPPTTVVSDA
jgi:hypothetical protein